MLIRMGSWVVALLVATLMTFVGCEGGGAGNGTGTGDGSTGGGAGTGGACGSSPVPPDQNTLATFEDGFGSVLQQGTPPRNGGFYAYNDGAMGCVETPAAGAAMPAATAIEGGGRCGSQYGFRFFGNSCGYAGVGTDLAAPLPADGGAAAGDAAAAGSADAGTVAQKIPYDLRGYRQIKFWGRLGATAKPINQPVQLKLPMLIDTKIQDGGLCVEMTTAKCSASYGRFLSFGTAWQLFTVDLIPRAPGACEVTTGICQEAWGKVFTWDPGNVVSIQFQAAPGSTFDIWIDDIELVPN